METITVYHPRAWTRALHETTKRWNVIVAHRRAGKTTACLNHLIRDATLIPKSRFAFIAPTYKQAKGVAWDVLKESAMKFHGIRFNEAELRADFANGGRITLYGSDKPDSLRGLGFWGVVFDEYSQQPPNIFSEIIRPALADHEGYAIWIGTPKGKNEFFRLYERGKKDPEWMGVLLTVDDTGLISQKELDDSRSQMTPEEYEQEWYCSFEAAIRGAYYAKEVAMARKEKRIGKIPYDPALLVHTVWDLGVGDATAIGFFQKFHSEIRMIDYHEGSDTGMNYYIKVLKEKSYIYGKHFAPHDIEVREFSTGKSRKEIARNLGIDFIAAPKLSIDDGIAAGRVTFNRLWIDEDKCVTFLDAISQYRKEWDDKRGKFRDHPLHDWTSHAADMWRYAALVEDKMHPRAERPKDDDAFFRRKMAQKRAKEKSYYLMRGY